LNRDPGVGRFVLGLVAACLVSSSAGEGRAQTAPPYARVVVFEEDFESGTLGAFSETAVPNEPFNPYPATAGPCGVPGSTLWHAETYCDACPGPPIPIHAAMGTYAAAYNRMDEVPPDCTYDTGAPNAGAIETGAVFWPSWPPVPMSIVLEFDVQRVTQPGTGSPFLATPFYDRVYVEADSGLSPGPCGRDWRVVTDLPLGVTYPCPTNLFTVVIVNHAYLDFMAGSNRPFRFRFDTIDANQNGYRGAYIDNVRILNSFCTPCIGTEGGTTLCLPRIESTGGTPRVGNANFGLRVTEAPANLTAAVLVLGVSHTTWGTVSLPWLIPGTAGPYGSCTLCVSPDVLLPAAPVLGSPCATSATQPLPIPASPPLAGAQVYAQWAILGPTQNAAGVITSDAAAVVIQP
jgi:hypothetical protein